MPVVPFVPQKKQQAPEVSPTFLAIAAAQMRQEVVQPKPEKIDADERADTSSTSR